jgi:translocation and assembly module TamB
MSDELPPSPEPMPRRRRKFGVWGWGAVAGAIVLTSAAAVALWWALASAGGTAWLLARLPSLEFVEPQGSLIGDFSARQMTIRLAGTGRIVIDNPRWEGLRARYTADPNTWVAINARRLTADRVTVQTTPSANPKPFMLPVNLRLPVTVSINEVRLGELVLPGQGSRPLHDLQGKVQLGARGGSLHRVDDLSVRVDPMLVRGRVEVGVEAPMALNVDLTATQVPDATSPNLPAWARDLRNDWRAELKARGPLARFSAEARLRAQGQQLDATGVVALMERWPLPQLEATTQALDLSAFLTHAPATQLSGSVSIAPTGGADKPASSLSARGTLSNAQSGRWDEQRLPLRRLVFDLRGQADRPDRFDLVAAELQFGAGAKEAGSIHAEGQWDAGNFELRTTLQKLQPGVADPRLPAMLLNGPITVSGTATDAASKLPTNFKALADLSGRLDASARAVQLRLEATGNAQRVDVKEFRASADQARATLSGHAQHDGGTWRVEGHSALVDFDPQPWFPGHPSTAWQRGPHRVNAKADWKLQLPDSIGESASRRGWIDQVAAVRGEATASVADSVLAGVPVGVDLKLSHPTAASPLQASLSVDAGDNQVKLDGELAASPQGREDRWTTTVHAPTIGRLAPLLSLLPQLERSGLLDGLTGALDAEGRLDGRWPTVTTQGSAKLASLRAGPLASKQAKLRWQAGTPRDATLDVLAEVDELRWNGQQLDATRLQLQGTARDHALTLQTEARAAPPAWVNALQGTANAAKGTGDAHTLARLSARGGASGGVLDEVAGNATPQALGWKGVVQLLELRGSQPGALPWFRTRDVALDLRSGDKARISAGDGRAEMLDAVMRWSRIDWQAGSGLQTQQLDIQAELEPLAVAPLLRRLQPEFGWGGDLQMGGRIVMRQAAEFSAEIVFERTRGDLQVTDDAGTQPLGLTDLRLGLTAQDGVWSFTQGLAGKQLGVAAGAVVVRTSANRAWPEANAPIQGVLEAQVANLGTWGPWVPPGWRLGGKLGVTASIGGRFGAPEYTGQMSGSGIAVRNLLLGVDVTDGELGITLEGETARIRTFSARAGSGRIELSGDATFGTNPRAQLALLADKFQVLGRVDRRVVASGEAKLLLERESLKLDGKLRVDEGLFDFTLGDAPTLGGDVVVTGRTDTEEPLPEKSTAKGRTSTVDLQVNLGDQLRVKGRGIDTLLRGDIRLTTPGGRLALNGSVRAEEGNYAAYGQKLTIDRGVITFAGPPENPRLDIEATRPNLDVRVGVQISGSAQNPRVRLFSDSDMSDTDRLSWLLLGRGSEGLGTGDTALLQSAALALLAGEGEGVTDQITKAIGIDEVSLRQTDGEVRETVVTLGKQLSRRWYVGYERSLQATTGNWQLIYRIAQRFTLRAQSGLDNSLDLIWTWRWE